MEAIGSIKDLYLEFVKDIYHAEVLLVPELRLFEGKAKTLEVRKALKNHITKTNAHIAKLEEIQEYLNSDLLQEHCRTMKSMILETKDLVKRCTDDKIVERAIVGSLHRITHCLITIYQMLISMADELELNSHKDILQKNLQDEIYFDKTISAFGFNQLVQELNLTKKLS